MTKEIITVAEGKEPAPHHKKEFKGYSIEEIRYQRALVAMKKEFCKNRIITDLHRIQKRGFFGKGEHTSNLAHVGGIAGKIMSGMNYIDYALVGMSIFGTVRKIFRFFNKKNR